MTETKFTPGPWEPVRLSTGGAFAIKPKGLRADGVRGMVVFDMPEIDADAHLIAAAPDLYAALESLLGAEWMVTHDWGGDRGGVKAKCEAALAKARGES